MHASLYASFRDALVAAARKLPMGDPRQEDTFIGPMISEADIPGNGPQPDTGVPLAEEAALSGPAEDDPDRPKRRGWWQRWN